MVITHVAVALSLSVPVALLAPEYAGVAAAGAVVGGVFPDLDLLVGEHRRTLHFPVYGSVLAVVASGMALVVPTPLTVGVAVALVGAAVHAASDALGAGEELRPWERTNPNAVYDHFGGRWWRARYLIPYDGSARDLAVAAVAALAPLVVYDGWVRWLLVGALSVAAVYALLRRRLVPYFERVV
jgi:hypothetical protein